MDALFLFGVIAFAWTSPLLLFPLVDRCPSKQIEWWLAIFLLSSWIGFTIYLYLHYWRDAPVLKTPMD